jgi:hypothetical protein
MVEPQVQSGMDSKREALNEAVDAASDNSLFSQLTTVNCQLTAMRHGRTQEQSFKCFSFWRQKERRNCSVRHRADFFFDFGDIHHDDGVPWAAVQEAPIWAFTEALFAADALDGVYLDAPERRIVFIRHPEHAILDRAVLHTGR